MQDCDGELIGSRHLSKQFEVFSAAAADVEKYIDARQQSLQSNFERLIGLGIREADFSLLWPNGPREAPDWDAAERYGPDIHDIVYLACIDGMMLLQALLVMITLI